jgi:hypothetical protein
MEQLLVEQALVFENEANIVDNIYGNWCRKKLVIYDDFVNKTLDTERWTTGVGAAYGGTEAITAAQGGTATLTTGASATDRSILASPLIFLAAKNPVIEARIKVSGIATIGVNFGFNDTATEGDNVLAMEITAAAFVNALSSDAVMFVYDTGATNDFWHIGAVKNDVEGTPALIGAPAYVTSYTAELANSPLKLSPGSTTVTIQKTGTFYVTLPDGAKGTATNGTGTFTGSAITLAAGRTAIVCTVVGTITILYGNAPSTTFETLRVALDSSANAYFWRNGVPVGGLKACTTAATPLCLFLGVINRTTSARVLTIDYIKAWQDR